MATSAELRQQRAQVWERAKEIVDAAEAETRDLNAEELTNWSKLHEDMASLESRAKRQEDLEKTPASESRVGPTERPGETGSGKSTEEKAEESRAAFNAWARHGIAGISPEHRQILGSLAPSSAEARALGIAPNSAAGYFVPDQYQRSIEIAMAAFGGMREAATVFQTSDGADLYIPTMSDTSNVGELVGEHQAVTEQDIAVGQRLYRAYVYSSKEVKVSYQLLQDSAFDIESLLRDVFAERIGRITNTHFTTGVGADRPTGIINDTVLGVTAAAQGAVTADELINMVYAIDRAYRPGSRWMFHSNTLRDLSKLKDGDGRYMWQPGMTGGGPGATLFGYGYVVNDDMPTMATTARAILFGQLGKYRIRDVSGIRVIRLDERYAENLQVAFFAFSRHDGRLLDAGGNPIKHIAMA